MTATSQPRQAKAITKRTGIKMEKSPLTALTLIIVGAMFTSLNAFAIDGQVARQASASIDVIADVEDMIDITPATNAITFNNLGATDWQETLSFTVRRRGASLDLNTPKLYSVRVSGTASGSDDVFYLQDTANAANTIEMSISYQTTNGIGDEIADTMNFEQASGNLSTYIGIDSTNSADNLEMTMTIPEEQIINATPATYSTDLTVMVAAI